MFILMCLGMLVLLTGCETTAADALAGPGDVTEHWPLAANSDGLPAKVKVDRHGNLVPSPCYERMKAAIQSASAHIEHREHGVSITPSVIMSEAKWEEFRKTAQECAR